MLEIAKLEQATGTAFEGSCAGKDGNRRRDVRDGGLQDCLRDFDLLSYAQRMTGEETGYGKAFRDCPVCGHHDCFVVYRNAGGPDTWACFSASSDGNAGKNAGGTIIDFLKHTRGLTSREATKAFLQELCGEDAGGVLPDGCGGAEAAGGGKAHPAIFRSEYVPRNDKDYSRMLQEVAPFADAFVATQPHNPRALSADDLGVALQRVRDDVPVAVCPDADAAVRTAKTLAGGNGLVVAFGSLYQVGQIKGLLLG